MSPTAKITTYACFFGIIILFLFLGYSSINNIKSVKLDPETYYIAKFIDKGKELSDLSEKIYIIIKKKHKTNPNITVTIKDSKGELEEFTQLEIVCNEIEKKLRKAKQLNRFTNKFEQQEFSDKYQKAISYYNEATEIVVSVCEEAIEEMEAEEFSTQLIPGFSKFQSKLGKDGSKIKYYIKRANNSLKH